MLDATQKYGQHIIILFMLRCQTDMRKKNIPISESGKYLFLYSCFNAKRETEDIFCRQRAIDEFADEVKVATR